MLNYFSKLKVTSPYLIFRAIGLVLLLAVPTQVSTARAVRCSDFQYQEDAQVYFVQNHPANMDGDRDGVACERLPHRGNASPSSAPSSSAPLATPAKPLQFSTEVTSVGDGDTFRINYQGKRQTVRLACIDAPEMAQNPYGQEAALRLKQLIPIGQTITLKVVDSDRYNRIVAIVYSGDTIVNLEMVKEGRAVVYYDYLNRCPELKGAFIRAETVARYRRIGFWRQQNPVLPSEFRRQVRSLSNPSN
jgi:micrococcal nuclease